MNALCTNCHRPHTIDHYPEKWLVDGVAHTICAKCAPAGLLKSTPATPQKPVQHRHNFQALRRRLQAAVNTALEDLELYDSILD